MEKVKLRIVFHEDRDGVQSYFYLEKREGMRVIELLKLLPTLQRWTYLSKIAETLKEKPNAVLSTIQKLAGAERIDVKVDGQRKVLARGPVLLIAKDKHNTRSNLTRQKFLRPSIRVRSLSRL